MKKLLLTVLLTLSFNSYATIDSNTNVFIPVRHIQSGEYFVQIAPMIGCYGLPRGPQIQQLVKPYMVNNLGCGTESTENINALECAEVISAIESDDFSTFKEITLDISNCAEKNESKFIEIVKKVIPLNFATKRFPNPKLVLVKTSFTHQDNLKLHLK